jgi:hypothetical protein
MFFNSKQRNGSHLFGVLGAHQFLRSLFDRSPPCWSSCHRHSLTVATNFEIQKPTFPVTVKQQNLTGI